MDNIILRCDNNINGIFTAIYDAFVYKNQMQKENHEVYRDNISIEIGIGGNYTLFSKMIDIETDEIKPGESREYQVVLRWQNGDSNIGTKGNRLSIITENEAGFEEKDKTDNESKADLIVAVETGEVTYVAIAGSILIVMIAIASGIYVIKKKRQ